MRTIFEFGIVVGIVAAVAAALGGCAQNQASFAPIASDSRSSDHRVSQAEAGQDRASRTGRRASLAGYQTAQAGGSQEQPKPADNDPAGQSQPVDSMEDNAKSATPPRRPTVDANSNGTDQPQQVDEDNNNRESRTGRSRRPYTSPSFAEDYAEGALASASMTGGVFNPQLGREVAEGSLINAPSISGERGLAASQPTARQTVSGARGLGEGTLANFTPASPNNVLTPQANPRSGANGACAQLTRNGLSNNQACATNVNRSIGGRSVRLTIGRGIRR